MRPLRRSAGFGFQVGRPLALEWDNSIHMWTNYNMRERYLCDGLCLKGRFERPKEILDKAMNQCLPEGKKTKLRWRWYFDGNDVVRSPHGPRWCEC